MTPSQSAASLALAQVNLILAETQQQAVAHARYAQNIRTLEKQIGSVNADVTRLLNESGSEALAISARVSQLEAEVQKFAAFLETLGVKTKGDSMPVEMMGVRTAQMIGQ